MDLLAFLEQKNEVVLYEKMKELVDLRKNQEMAKEILSILNKNYNLFLTQKQEQMEQINDIKRKSATPIEIIGDKIANILDDNPLIVMCFFILIPFPLLALVLICFPPSFLLYRLSKVLAKKTDKNIKKALDEIKLVQNDHYEWVCAARKTYHDTRKEYEKKISELTPKELGLLHDYCMLEDEYTKSIEEYVQKLETQKQEQPEISKTSISEIKLSKII